MKPRTVTPGHRTLKRTSSTSTNTTAAIYADTLTAPEEILPPEDISLRDCDWPFWRRIIRAKGREEWAGVTLVLAAELARCQADIHKAHLLCDSGDRVAMEKAGYPSVRAVNQNIYTLSTRQLSLMRALGITGITVAGDPHELFRTRKAEREAETTIEALRAAEGLPARGKRKAKREEEEEAPLLRLEPLAQA